MTVDISHHNLGARASGNELFHRVVKLFGLERGDSSICFAHQKEDLKAGLSICTQRMHNAQKTSSPGPALATPMP